MDLALFIRFSTTIVLFALGGVYAKRFADLGQFHNLVFSFTAYFAGNLLFLEILKRGLGFGMVLSSMGQLILMVLIGVLLFGERFGPMQGVGLTLAILAIAAFSFGTDAG